MGEFGQVLGVAVYSQRGVIARMHREDDPQVLFGVDSLAVTLDEDPPWAREVVREAAGVPYVPCVMKMSDGRVLGVDDEDVAVLTAVLRAVCGLSARKRESQIVHETSGGDRIVVRISADPSGSAPVARPEKIGRNSPCPCGSGKKYKRCCLLAEQTGGASEPPPPAAEQTNPGVQATIDVLRWIERTRPAAIESFEAACGEGINELPALYMPVFVHEFEIEPDVTPAQLYLQSRRTSLSRRQRSALEQAAKGWLSIWEVLAVAPGRGFEALDLLTGERMVIGDVSASHCVNVRTVLLGRVIPGVPAEIDGVHGHTLGPDRVETVLAAARKALRVRTKQVEPAKLRSWASVKVLIGCWNDALTHEEPRVQTVLRNTDGDPCRATRDTYAITRLEADEVARRLLGDDRILGDDGDAEHDLEVTFTRFGNPIHPGWFRTTIGTGTLDARTFVVETGSPRRADEIRQQLELALGDHIELRDRHTEDVQEIEVSGDEDPMIDATLGNVQIGDREHLQLREHLRQFEWQQHDRLGGATPRDAVRKANTRRTLHRMLCEHEYRAESEAHLAEIALLRRRLGLADDGARCKVDRIEREMGFGIKASETLLDLAGPLLSEPLDEGQLEAVLRAAEVAWNHAPGHPALATLHGIQLLTAAGISESMAKRYAELLVERRALFEGDLRMFEIAELRRGSTPGLKVITRAPPDVHRRWVRAQAGG